VAAQQLEDPDALLAGKAEDIALSMLEKYIESKIGA